MYFHKLGGYQTWIEVKLYNYIDTEVMHDNYMYQYVHTIRSNLTIMTAYDSIKIKLDNYVGTQKSNLMILITHSEVKKLLMTLKQRSNLLIALTQVKTIIILTLTTI